MEKLFRVRVARDNDEKPILGESELTGSTESLDAQPSRDAVLPHKPRSNTFAAETSHSRKSFYNEGFVESDSRRGSLHSDSAGDLEVNGDPGMKVRSSLSLRRDGRGLVGPGVLNPAIGEKLAMSNLEQYSKLPTTKENGNNNLDDEEGDCASTSETVKGEDACVDVDETVNDAESLRCGWLLWRPDCIQVSEILN